MYLYKFLYSVKKKITSEYAKMDLTSQRQPYSLYYKNPIVYLKKSIVISLWGRISPFCRDQERSDKQGESGKPLRLQIIYSYCVR